jgi:signal transduction histidine kinase/CHASE3 domain sensor protein
MTLSVIMERLLSRNTSIGFWLSLVALLGIGALSYDNLTRYRVAAEWTAYTQKTLVNTEALTSQLWQAEAEQRNFLVIKDQAYLEQYRRAITQVNATVKTLKDLTGDNARQQERLVKLEPFIRERIQILQQGIALVENNRPEVAIALARTSRVKQIREQIRVTLEEVKAEEQTLLQERSLAERERLNTVAALTIPGCLGVALFLELTIWHLRRNLQKRLQAEQVLQKQNEKLGLLYETTRDLLSAEEPILLLDTLYEKLSAQLSLDFYFNYLVETRDGKLGLKLASYRGLSQPEAEEFAWLEFGQAMCGRVAKDGQQISLGNVQTSSFAAARLIKALGIRAYSGQPLVVQGRVLGVLSFASRSRNYFSPEETELMQVTADQIAIALDRANLLTSLQRRSEQLAESNRIKDEFLAILSHELRTPLNPILGWTQLLQNRKVDQAGIDRALEIIERNAKIQIRLIDDLLDVSKILKGKLTLNSERVDLREVVENAIDTLHLASAAKSIQVEYRSPAQSCMILGDPNRLQQIVWNLLSNAIKFTPPHGRVEVELSQLDTNRSVAQILVRDTGKGIQAEFLPYIFDYFRQADSTTTRQFGGLGLGLAIVRHLVELHGGTIRAKSDGDGKGAAFTVRLPLKDEVTERSEVVQPMLFYEGSGS